jgi:hypothetical protein
VDTDQRLMVIVSHFSVVKVCVALIVLSVCRQLLNPSVIAYANRMVGFALSAHGDCHDTCVASPDPLSHV